MAGINPFTLSLSKGAPPGRPFAATRSRHALAITNVILSKAKDLRLRIDF
jgi:hypothetical protein